MKLLIDLKAGINVRNEIGCNPVAIAIINRFYSLTEYLLSVGADPEVEVSTKKGWKKLSWFLDSFDDLDKKFIKLLKNLH